MIATRKLAAIVAADVVGYSRLMGEDEGGTARAVRERREAAEPIVASFGGRIVKTTGDGPLLEYPSVVAVVEYARRYAARNIPGANQFSRALSVVEFLTSMQSEADPNQPRKARVKSWVSSRSVLAGRCSRDTANSPNG